MVIKNRLIKNYKHRRKLAKKWPTDCFRLYEKDIPDYPFIIDVYGTSAIIYYLGKDFDQVGEKKEYPNLVKKYLCEILNTKLANIYFKERKKQKGISQYNKTARKDQKIIVNELTAKFEINLSDYLDSGLFLDHRPLRKVINENIQGKSFLNLFSYTCSVSVLSALGGATTTSVDLSKTYLEWGKRNFSLNEIDQNSHQFINKDCLQYLNELKNDIFYDVIFIDPPTFSNSKKLEDDFEVESFQDQLVDKSISHLAKDGLIYFSTNKKTFKLSNHIIEKYDVKDISQQSIPFDFRDKKIHYCFEIRVK